MNLSFLEERLFLGFNALNKKDLFQKVAYRHVLKSLCFRKIIIIFSKF